MKYTCVIGLTIKTTVECDFAQGDVWSLELKSPYAHYYQRCKEPIYLVTVASAILSHIFGQSGEGISELWRCTYDVYDRCRRDDMSSLVFWGPLVLNHYFGRFITGLKVTGSAKQDNTILHARFIKEEIVPHNLSAILRHLSIGIACPERNSWDMLQLAKLMLVTKSITELEERWYAI